MKHTNELSDEVLATTMRIQLECPELSKYLEEMPVTIPIVAEPVISDLNLKEYNESLKLLLNKYSCGH
jgi:hypothetical protein